ncbi:MAG TPA: site-specific integrase [Anaerolineales bacterium]|nr:site-specific integrase [Anaerolineales bacterium]
MTHLIPTAAGTDVESLGAVAREYASHSKAPSTLRNYRAGWAEFASWCQAQGRESLPASPATVADYIGALAANGAKASTINLKRCAIGFAHRAANLADPTAAEVVRAVLSGITRKIGSAPDRKAPLTLEALRPALAALPDSIAGVRDRAILLLGFACALRRSELVALDASDLLLAKAELRVTIRRSKTDQTGIGTEIIVPAVGGELCPVQAVGAWLEAAEITGGPVFRRVDRHGRVGQRRLSAQSVALIVKAAARRAGLDWRRLSGHSMRAGFATQAALNGVNPIDAMAVTRHKSQTVFSAYIRAAGVQQRQAIAAALRRSDR